MEQLPSHPDTHEDSAAAPTHEPPSTKRHWGSVVWVAAGVVVVLAMVVLHLAGVVGPGNH